MITKADIIRYDKSFLAEGIDLPSRPMRAGMAYLKEKNIDFLNAPNLDVIMETSTALYKDLYPNRDFDEYGIFHGGVSFRGEVYKATVHIVYGSARIEPLKSIQIGDEELDFIIKEYPDDFWKGYYSIGDLWDFGYGIDDSRGKSANADKSWEQARGQLAATYRTLDAYSDLDAAIQSICMTAELSMKGVLYTKGYSETKVRNISHDLGTLAEEVNKYTSSSNPGRLEMVANQFPHYVKSRYEPSGLTKPELLEFATKAQFVAGECLRRVSGRGLAMQMENTPGAYPRRVA